MERAVFDACLAHGIPLVWILARGLSDGLPSRTQRALDADRLLILTPFDESVDGFSAARAAWSNQYALHLAASAVIGAVAFPMFARLKDDLRRTTAAFAALLGGMFLLLLPVYGLVFALAPLLEQALGERWVGTAPVVQILAVAAGVTAILGELCAQLLMGRGRADQAFHLEWVQTGGLLLALWPSLLWLGLPGAPVAWVIGNALSMLLAFALVRRLLPGAMAAAAPRIAAALAAGLIAGVAAWGVSHGLDGLLGLLLAGLTGVAVAVAVLWSLNRPLALDLGGAIALLTRRTSP